MIDRIEDLNRRQMSSKKPVVEKASVHYEWQDGDLLDSLVEGVGRFCPYRTETQNKESEDAAVGAANRIAGMVGWGCDVAEIEKALEGERQSMDAYGARRLWDMGARIVGVAKCRSSLLVYGEGGIGKTYFLYELAQRLEKAERPYAIAFNQAGIFEIEEVGIETMVGSCESGFTLLVDACNELDEEGFSAALGILSEALRTEGVNIVIATRSGSPTSRIEELKDVVAESREFGGVEPSAVYDLLSECSDGFIIQYQDMLFSNNPRNLNIMAQKIAEFKPGQDGRKAVTQRTALIEECIKQKPLNKERWRQTKQVCRFLYGSDGVVFSRDDVVPVLGSEADSYITDMLSSGFIECFSWEGLKYSFSSESQIRYVVARFLNDDLDLLHADWSNPKMAAQEVAKLVSQKSGKMYGHEMAQVAIDRYCHLGPTVVVDLISAMVDQGITFQWASLLRQTIFPDDADFSEVASQFDVDPCFAFVEFGGIMNTPFNLTNYANAKIAGDQGLLEEYSKKNWQNWQLDGLIRRVRSIAEYVSISGRVPERGAVEWVWLAVWCSHSSNVRLRAVSQRLLFVVCDSSDAAIEEALKAWTLDTDVYARRAISKALASLCMGAKSRCDVRAMVETAMRDACLTDSVVISNLCQLRGGETGPTDFVSRNVYVELGCRAPNPDDVECFRNLVWEVDLFMKGFFPFDISELEQGEVSLSYCRPFIEAPVEAVREWNTELKGKLRCGDKSECCGLCLSETDFEEYQPVTFSTQELDKHELMNCVVLLVKAWLERFGGDLEHMLGEYRVYAQDSGFANSPNRKPIDCAIGEFLGSLSANYYQSEIIVGGEGFNRCGFSQYKEEAYDEPGRTCAINPVSSHIVDAARSKLARRIVSPSGKPDEWFDDIEEACSEILGLLEPIKLSGKLWHPIAVDARSKIRADAGLSRSNEILISCAFDCFEHIDGGRDDRYLTIEHKDFIGNMRDYPMQVGALCLVLPELDEEATVGAKNPVLLPPPSMVKALGLEYDSSKGVFVDAGTGEAVIMCDGNPGSFYEEPACGLILLRDDVFQKLAPKHRLTFFAFTERFREGAGYANKCNRHWEFGPDGSQLMHFANESRGYDNLRESAQCKGCYFSVKERGNRGKKSGLCSEPSIFDEINELIAGYAAEDLAANNGECDKHLL